MSDNSTAPSPQEPAVLVFGSANVDLVCRVRSIARPGETTLAPSYEQLFGGKGANQAVAAARAMGGTGRVALIAAVGDDAFGAGIGSALRAEGVDVSALQTVAERTGCAFISIDRTGENAITVASGANLHVRAADAPAALFQAKVLVLQMETPFAETLSAAERAQAGGAKVVVNLAPVPADLDEAELRRLLAVATVLVVNESELAAAAMLLGAGGETAEASAENLARHAGLTVVATLGARGAVLAASDRGSQTIPVFPVEVVDTTGAGDTFVGVLAAGLAEGLAEGEAAVRAAVAASLACRKVGAQTAMPRAAEIDAALADAGR
ncbi:ribokinase [Jiella sp. M17.18]|uniref:ribokinase n=1 Tax=Jiella sp. M17.18 TaxID=3234247 RepID=UPI0034E021FF